jgi:3-oxoacyl-[acyl-carrier-protein] synthase-3
MINYGKITATASYLPEKVVTNDDLTQILDTTDEWIQSRTGIRERRIAGANENTSTMCIRVAEKLLQKSGVAASELDFILVATMSPDYTMPATAVQVQGAIGANKAFAFDVSAACSGFVFALATAEKLIRGGYARGLVIGGEKISKMLDWQDRSTAVLFGDGAGGVLLEAAPEQYLMKEQLSADGARCQGLTAGYRVSDSFFAPEESAETAYLKMDGRAIFDFVMKDVLKHLKEFTEDEEVDLFLLHQANRKMIHKVAQKLKLPVEKFPTNVESYGNTSAASIPILLDELVTNGQIRLDGTQRVVFTGYGGGLTWGSTLIRL